MLPLCWSLNDEPCGFSRRSWWTDIVPEIMLFMARLFIVSNDTSLPLTILVTLLLLTVFFILVLRCNFPPRSALYEYHFRHYRLSSDWVLPLCSPFSALGLEKKWNISVRFPHMFLPYIILQFACLWCDCFIFRLYKTISDFELWSQLNAARKHQWQWESTMAVKLFVFYHQE